MFKKYIYKLIHIIGLLAAIINLALMSFELEIILIEDTLSSNLLTSIIIKFFMIFISLSIYAGLFDSLIARIINDDSKTFISLSSLLTIRKEFIYKVFINWGGVFLIIGMFSFNWISYDMKLLNTQIIGITDLHIFLLCSFLLIFQKKIFKKEIIIFLIISTFYITYSLNQGHGLFSTLQGFKDYFSVIWLYIFFKYFRFKNETVINYIKVLKLMVLIQLPIQLMQFIFLRDPEFCSGTFGYHGTGVMGIFWAGIVLYIISVKKINLKNLFLILYLCLSLLIGASMFFFIINFFLVPFVLIKRYKVRILSKILLVFILCLIFLGFLKFNKFLKEESRSEIFNPFYYFSIDYYGTFFAVNEASLHRGGAILWTYSTLKEENKLFTGRGVGWLRNLAPGELEEFKKLTIGYDFPIVLLLSGIFGLLIFFYLAYNLFKTRIREALTDPRLKIFILCLALLYFIGGVYSQGWISRTTGNCFAMLIGILSNKNNKKFFIEKYLKIKQKNV